MIHHEHALNLERFYNHTDSTDNTDVHKGELGALGNLCNFPDLHLRMWKFAISHRPDMFRTS